MTSTRVLIGRRIRELRIASGLSQGMLARRADIDQRDVSAYENGRAFPRAERLDAIIKALDGTPEAFFGKGPLPSAMMSRESRTAVALIEQGLRVSPEFTRRVVRALKLLFG